MKPAFRICWDSEADCYRIYQRDAGWQASWGSEYVCLNWMRFATVEVAEAHIALHGLPRTWRHVRVKGRHIRLVAAA